MKKCGKCGLAKPLEAFHRRGSGRQAWFRVCRREYDRSYHAANATLRRQQARRRHQQFVRWYQALKTDTPCADCGLTFHPAAMNWGHLPGTHKIADVGTLATQHSYGAVLREIEKCELVCANCHAVRSYERRRGVAQPG
jgi:hypothetical protein